MAANRRLPPLTKHRQCKHPQDSIVALGFKSRARLGHHADRFRYKRRTDET